MPAFCAAVLILLMTSPIVVAPVRLTGTLMPPCVLIVKSGPDVLTFTPAPLLRSASGVDAVRLRMPSCEAVAPPFSPMEKFEPLSVDCTLMLVREALIEATTPAPLLLMALSKSCTFLAPEMSIV